MLFQQFSVHRHNIFHCRGMNRFRRLPIVDADHLDSGGYCNRWCRYISNPLTPKSLIATMKMNQDSLFIAVRNPSFTNIFICIHTSNNSWCSYGGVMLLKSLVQRGRAKSLCPATTNFRQLFGGSIRKRLRASLLFYLTPFFPIVYSLLIGGPRFTTECR